MMVQLLCHGASMELLTTDLIAGNRTALQLLAALLLGMLVGLERGWEARGKQAGERIAGIRTHALIGLLGGLAVLLANTVSPWILPTLLLVVAAVALAGYVVRAQRVNDVSVTNVISMVLTFCFGALAMTGEVVLAATATVITVLLLDNKREIHGLLNRLQENELDAGLKLLLISVVILPLLPNRELGPYNAINPFAVWWMVVLIASISFIGYFAMRVWGPQRGILFTSLFAGLSSSTALTLQFSRQSRDVPHLSPLLASGVLIACGTMFPRILVYCALLSPTLLKTLTVPVIAMAACLYIPALLIWHRHHQLPVSGPALTHNPLELKSAVKFGLLIAAILFTAALLNDVLGDRGLYLLAAVAGITDVDAITLSVTRMTQDGLGMHAAAIAIVVAASVNSLVKSVMAIMIGTRQLALLVGSAMLLSLGAGLLLVWWP